MQEMTEGFPLSPGQSDLWTLQQESQNQTAYCVQCVVLIAGELETNNFQLALEHVVDRNEILRTVFYRRLGVTTPLQVVLNSSTPIFAELDLRNLNPQAQEAKINELAVADRHVPFDLAHGPLLRLQLLVLSNNTHTLVITLPLLCMDSWTMQNFVRELALSYDACAKSEQVTDEPLRYVQFSQWQNELLEDDDEESAAGKEYWRKQSQTDFRDVQLPLESHNNTAPAFEPGALVKTLPAAIVSRLQELAHAEKAGAADLLLASWLTLLHKLTGVEEMGVSVQSDGRRMKELSTALGLLARALPLRADFQSGAVRFSALLAAVGFERGQGERWQDYFSHDQLTRAETTGALSPEAKSVGPPTKHVRSFPFGFECQEQPERICGSGICWTVVQQWACSGPYKVKLECVLERNGPWRLQLHYDARVLSRAVVERMAAQYEMVLTQVVSKGVEVTLAELEVMSDGERQEVVDEYNRTDGHDEGGECLHELFAAQVERTPEAVAAVYEDEQLSYGELNRRANQLGHYLQQLGVGPESLVAVMLERSLNLVVGLLAVLKAGGAYVPIDPEYPRERIRYLLTDCRATVLLTQAELAGRISGESEDPPTIEGCRVVELDSERERIAGQSKENVSSAVSAKNPAYVIYTSGSTGRPKGVCVEHRQVVNYVKTVTEELDLSAAKSFAMVSTFSADLGNTVLFPSLISGGRLHVISAAKASDPDGLADYFKRHSVDCLKIVPSHFAALHGSEAKRLMPGKKLILGGEASRWPWVRALMKAAPNCEIYNHYGPTETTVGVLTYRVQAAESNSTLPTVPLGRALRNIQVYVLDARMRLVPLGVVGELYVGGAGIARGYLHNPDLTAARFLPDPFGKNAGARLYRTGDMVRVLSDRNLDYLGRADGQVKVRGYRIELAEIEAILCEHASVKESVVVAQEIGNDKRLVAYVVGSSSQPASVNDLRDHAQAYLPQHMVPSWYVFLRQLPLMPSGKVDRQALPAPELERPEMETPYEAPASALEKTLAGIWSNVLGVERVGIRDSFFALGGDSILSVRVVALAKEKGLRFTIQQLFQHQTIKELAVEITPLDAANSAETQNAPEDSDELLRLLEEVDQLSEAQVLLKIEENMQLAEARES